MLNKELISTNIPTLDYQETAGEALSMMKEHHLEQLPVIDNDKYLGIVFEEDLINLPSDQSIQKSNVRLSRVMVPAHQYYLQAVQVAMDYRVGIVPVVENEELLGVIHQTDLFLELGKQNGVQDPGGIIVLEMDSINFSFSEISRLVETNDAQITQLNTFRLLHPPTLLVVLRVNTIEISTIVATFQRYDYKVKYYFGEEKYENQLKSNFDHLMNYLNL